jgi:hypothetical protein
LRKYAFSYECCIKSIWRLCCSLIIHWKVYLVVRPLSLTNWASLT